MGNLEDTIKQLRRILKEKIFRNSKVIGYEIERKDLLDLFKRTVHFGESNSALLIGPRSVGKTVLVNDVLTSLQQDDSFNENALLVRLNGLVHTDDKLALKSITSQMDLDNAVNGKVFGSFAENLTFLLACLKAGHKETSKSILFILEEFDLFCAHHNQTLLYNLFDVAQSAQTPVCILGITTRLDVIELFEKRVKSRFSHRQFFIFFENDLDKKLNHIKNILLLNEDIKGLNKTFKKEWNSHVTSLIDSKSFKNIIQRIVDIDLSEKSLKNILFQVVSKLSPANPQLKLEFFEEQLRDFERDDMIAILEGLSVLELCLLIAMKHHVEIYDSQAFNFEMIFTRYMKFVNANSNVQTVQRPVVLKAFEHIQKMELIGPNTCTTVRLQKEYQPFKLLLATNQIVEAVKNIQNLPTEVVQWASSSLV